LLEIAREAASAAADVIQQFYDSGFEVRTKADATPVTEADEAAEKIIRATIARHAPDHGFYGEEFGRERDDAEFLWLIDPIDGTKSFVRGYPFFSTQIAVMHRGELVVGVSSAPWFGETAWAIKGEGAWRNDRALTVSDIGSLADAFVSTGNIGTLAAGPRWSRLGRIVQQVSRIRGYGDFYHYHLLAAGGADAVIESDVNILDIAALAVIVEEAGGVFTDLEGGDITLDTRTVLAANPHLHPILLEQLNHD
jgi:histidinol-phosphatase